MKFKLPAWLTRGKLNLPDWARVEKHRQVEDGTFCVSIQCDTDGYVREWLPLLGKSVAEADQYWLEVAYQCAKMDVQLALEGTPYDPRTAGKPARVHFTRCNHWRLQLHPVGRGPTRATQGLEARDHYRRVRGRLPL